MTFLTGCVLYIVGFALTFHFTGMLADAELRRLYPDGDVPYEELVGAWALRVIAGAINPAVIVVALVMGVATILAELANSHDDWW